MSAAIVLLDPADQALVTINWSDVAIGGLEIVGFVTHTVPAPLVKIIEITDVATKTSQVRVTGAVHGGMYMVEATVELSNGEILNRQFPLRAFNG